MKIHRLSITTPEVVTRYEMRSGLWLRRDCDAPLREQLFLNWLSLKPTCQTCLDTGDYKYVGRSSLISRTNDFQLQLDVKKEIRLDNSVNFQFALVISFSGVYVVGCGRDSFISCVGGIIVCGVGCGTASNNKGRGFMARLVIPKKKNLHYTRILALDSFIKWSQNHLLVGLKNW